MKIKNVVLGLLFSAVFIVITYLFFIAINGHQVWTNVRYGDLDITLSVMASRVITVYAVVALMFIIGKTIELISGEETK